MLTATIISFFPVFVNSFLKNNNFLSVFFMKSLASLSVL